MAKFFDLKKPSIKISKEKYTNGRVALIAEEGHEMWCTCTVNVPDVKLEDDEIIIKDYSENEGVLQDLIDLNIVSEPIRHTLSGFVTVPICKLYPEEKWLKKEH